jgi:hypothetical protein
MSHARLRPAHPPLRIGIVRVFVRVGVVCGRRAWRHCARGTGVHGRVAVRGLPLRLVVHRGFRALAIRLLRVIHCPLGALALRRRVRRGATLIILRLRLLEADGLHTRARVPRITFASHVVHANVVGREEGRVCAGPRARVRVEGVERVVL